MDIKLHDSAKQKIEKGQGIYQIVNKNNGRRYVGGTTNFKNRCRSHIGKLNNKKHYNYKLQSDWIKCGEESFSFEILELVDVKHTIQEREQFYIDKFNSIKGGYNISNPKDEYHSHWVVDKYKVKNTKPKSEYKNTQKEVVRYLNEHFKHKLNDLHTYIDKKGYYIKNKADRWILNNIEDDDIKEDERIQGLMAKWYNQNGFSIAIAPVTKDRLKKYIDIDFPDDEILVSKEIMKKVSGDIKKDKIQRKKEREESKRQRRNKKENTKKPKSTPIDEGWGVKPKYA